MSQKLEDFLVFFNTSFNQQVKFESMQFLHSKYSDRVSLGNFLSNLQPFLKDLLYLNNTE